MKFNLNYSVAEDHPVVSLGFYLVGNITDTLTRSFEVMLVKIGGVRKWVIREPQLIDYVDEELTESGQEKLKRTYGAALSLYSAYPPWREKLPKNTDRAHFEEVTFVVNEIAKFSECFGVAFGVEMNEELIGEINNGEIDRGLRQGLLDEWKKELA